MLPSIFGENLFDDMFENVFDTVRSPLYGKHGKNLMKTDIRPFPLQKAWIKRKRIRKAIISAKNAMPESVAAAFILATA